MIKSSQSKTPVCYGQSMRTLPKTKRFYIVSTALAWATPMSIFFCALLWKFGALTIVAALALICMSVAVGFGFAAVLYEFVKRKYGPAKDDN
jgi:hypothetical protein